MGTLAFPMLTSAGCTSSPPADACYQSNNNVAGLTTSGLTIDDGANYTIGGNAITLGAGGLTASSAATTFGAPQLTLPITIQAPQTWSVDGNNSNNQLGLGSQSVTGTGQALTIALNHQTALGINRADIEAGTVTITSSDTGPLQDVVVLDGGKLNSTDGHPVTLSGGGAGLFIAASSTTGPLNSSGGAMQVGNGNNLAAKWSIAGGLTLNSASSLRLNIVKPGATAGTDFSQISATAAVNLAGALSLPGATSSGKCPALHVGDVDTLITSTGALAGTFTGTPDGTIVSLSCFGGVPPTLRINYTAHTVTATVLTAGGVNTVTNLTPDAGAVAGGNTVTISGRNFTNPATVKFGTSASPSVTFVSSTQLKAVAPAEAAGVVDVVVSSSGAASAKSTKDLYAYGPPSVSSFTPSSGTTGSTVTVTGTGFVPRARVKFGTLLSPAVTFVSSTQLKAVVPNGAAPGRIWVITAAGSAKSSTNFTPTMSITSFTPASGPVGTVVTINGVGFAAGATVSFNGTPASSVTFVSPSQLTAAVPAGASTGSITVSDANGTVQSATGFTVT